ncbi:TPA: hypothetical protein H1009_02425 [archaeon]|nr:hypothetical protein [Candidatus Naiadarchaeales archaeon SRR2090153.bin461]
MAEKKAIIPIKDLIELHEKANFPIDTIYLIFKDYDWLAKFLGSCFEQLYAHKRIKFRETFFEGESYVKYPRGLGALDKFVSKKLGYRDFNIIQRLTKKAGFPLLVIAYLARECGRKLEDVQPQISFMHLGTAPRNKNIGIGILFILKYSEIALAPHQILRILENEHGTRVSNSKINPYLIPLTNRHYLTKHGPKGEPLYTLRGEEYKFKKSL